MSSRFSIFFPSHNFRGRVVILHANHLTRLKEDIDIATRDNIAKYILQYETCNASDNAFATAGIIADGDNDLSFNGIYLSL